MSGFRQSARSSKRTDGRCGAPSPDGASSTLSGAAANVAHWHGMALAAGARAAMGEKLSKRRVWALVAAALLVAVPAPSQSVLRVAPETLARFLDPHFTTSFTTRDLGYLIYDTLFAVDENFEPKPQMVESYTVSPDKLTYVFVLRPGLKPQETQPETRRP